MNSARQMATLLFILCAANLCFALESPSCPQASYRVVLSCVGEKSPLHILSHVGTYNLVHEKPEVRDGATPDIKDVVCLYTATDWLSTYQLNDSTIQIKTIEDLKAALQKLPAGEQSKLQPQMEFAGINPQIEMTYTIEDGKTVDVNSEKTFSVFLGMDSVMVEPKDQTSTQILSTKLIELSRVDDKNVVSTGISCRIAIQ